jgi:hypothetical protein
MGILDTKCATTQLHFNDSSVMASSNIALDRRNS